MLIHSLRTSMCLLIFIHAFRHFRWLGGQGQWSCLFRRPHQVHGHFLQNWNFTNNPWKLLYLSGWSWSQFSIMAIPGAPHNFTLSTFTLNFLLSHILPNSLTNLPNFYSESATSAVSSANNSWFISNLPEAATICTQQLQPFPNHPNIHLSISQTTPSIYTLNNHGDITQPCLNPTLTGNHSLTSFPPGHMPYYLHKNSALLSTIYCN